MNEGNKLFPIFLKISQLDILIVGGGNVALEKANALLQNDSKAKLSFVAPFFREELLEFIKDFPQV
ncbi:MAG: Precorrin-2 dehydrogenase, partial [Bacteroidota bacterium]